MRQRLFQVITNSSQKFLLPLTLGLCFYQPTKTAISISLFIRIVYFLMILYFFPAFVTQAVFTNSCLLFHALPPSVYPENSCMFRAFVTVSFLVSLCRSFSSHATIPEGLYRSSWSLDYGAFLRYGYMQTFVPSKTKREKNLNGQ